MNARYDLTDNSNRIVYVKAVDVADLPEEVQAEAGSLDHLYGVYASSGEQLALVADRTMAFMLARQYDYAPVAVH